MANRSELGENLFASSDTIRRWIESAHFRYPSTRRDLTADLKGFSHLPVYPTLWGWIQTWPSPDELVKWLMEKVPPTAIRTEGRERVENRARKLVLDFGRDLHLQAMLAERFGPVSWKGSYDLDQDVDFIIPLPDGRVGLRAYMRAAWKKENWRQIKEGRRTRRGGQEVQFPVFDITNEVIAPRPTSNSVWLYTLNHVDEVERWIEGMRPESRPPLVEKRLPGL